MAILLSGCAREPEGAVRAPLATSASSPGAGRAEPVPRRDVAPLASAGQGASSAGYRDCGALSCKAFASAEAAFDYVLQERPRVLGVGEAHAQADGRAVPSSTRRFMDQLLPRLAPRASDLLIELWLANGSCGALQERVQKQQSDVTAPQAATNQGEFVELGHRAKALGVEPHALVPSCEQYRKIVGAGARDIEEMLVMIKSVTLGDVLELLGKRDPERLVVAYGGAMHNDLEPRPGREAFSFGPELSRATADRYVELDLVVPEQIQDTDAWRALPWHPHYPRTNPTSEAFLYSWAPHAYALIFPATGATEPAP